MSLATAQYPSFKVSLLFSTLGLKKKKKEVFWNVDFSKACEVYSMNVKGGAVLINLFVLNLEVFSYYLSVNS